MNEYKLIKSKFHWKDNMTKFETLINSYAREGWKVVGFTTGAHADNQYIAMLERNKNR